MVTKTFYYKWGSIWLTVQVQCSEADANDPTYQRWLKAVLEANAEVIPVSPEALQRKQ